MRIRAGFEITYDCPPPTPMLLMLNVHPSRRGDLETPDIAAHRPADRRAPVPSTASATSAAASWRRPAASTLSADFVDPRQRRCPTRCRRTPSSTPVEDLPDEVLVFLLGSRYCETDRLSDLAWSLFGDIAAGLGAGAGDRRLRPRPHHLRLPARPRRPRPPSRRTRRGSGVCRDYAHLAITLCRCMNIPARYCTGYLGDIGVPVVGADGFQRLVRGLPRRRAGTPSTPATTSRASAAS